MTDFVYDWGIVGLGYVGLPLAVEATGVGMKVLGFDVDESKVSSLRAGQSYVDDIDDATVREMYIAGFVATSSPELLGECAALSICVPTPWNGWEPDLAYVRSAAETIGRHLRPGQLVVLESTTHPGTTEEMVLPILEKASGLKASVDFHLAYSPERIDPGNKQYGLRNTPKIVAGVDATSSLVAEALYRKVCDEVVVLSGTREAEMSKLLENTYRLVNIALINEMALFAGAMGVDLHEVIRGAATKPFGFQPFYPSAGVGGHCIPVDPGYLWYEVSRRGHQLSIVEVALELNARMALHITKRAVTLLIDSERPVQRAKVVLAGVAYKPNVSDARETPARGLAELLIDMGVDVSYVDPNVETFAVRGRELVRHKDPLEAAASADLLIIVQAHREFDLWAMCEAASIALDTTGKTTRGVAHHI